MLINPKELKVGESIYEVLNGQIRRIFKIERVTKTQAITEYEGYKFHKEYYSDDGIRKIGRTDKWCGVRYMLDSIELKHRHQRQKAIRKIQETNYHGVSTDSLVKIVEIIESDVYIMGVDS